MRAAAALIAAALVAASCGSWGGPAPTTPRTDATGRPPAGTGPATSPAPTGVAGSAWTRIADIPTPRSEVAAVSHGGVVYVIGGFGGRAVVERYLPRTGRWERVADLPHGVDHPMAASVLGIQTAGDEGIYVLGGYVNGVASARSFLLDHATGRWTEIAPMPGPRAAGAAVAFGSRIYVVGGADAGRLVAPTYEYDLVTKRWRTVAAIPTPRDHLGAAAVGDRVCAVAGRRLSLASILRSMECYVPREDRWERRPEPPTARGGHGVASWGHRLYVVGGEHPGGTFREVEIYDLSSDTWSRGPDLPTPRHGIGAVVVGGTTEAPQTLLLVLTGGPTPGGSQTAVCEALALH